MDPITHTLVGANLAACRPLRKVRLAAPALIIGANLPDIDVLAFVAGGDAALGFRRGWTHGWPALLVLPLLLWAALRLWDRARARPGSTPAIGRWRPRLLGFCYLAVVSHPCLDWLNTYGVRVLMPLDGRWFYGDSVFIVDPWLWLVLGGAWLLRRRPAAARLAAAALVVGAIYAAALVTLHAGSEARVRSELARRLPSPVAELMVGPRPANPLAWDVVARSAGRYFVGRFTWPRGRLVVDRELEDARAHPLWPSIAAAAGDQVPGFLEWVRFPWLEIEDGSGGERDVYLMDARYTRRRTTGFGGARIRLPNRPWPASARIRAYPSATPWRLSQARRSL